MKNTPRRMASVRKPLDPHLVALLSFMDGPGGVHDNDHTAKRLDQAVAIAREMLASKPVASAFAEQAGRPSVAELVLKNRLPAKRLEALSTGRASATSDDVYSIIGDATLAGGALMFELLKSQRSDPPPRESGPRGVELAAACRRLGLSCRTGRRLLRDGTFPIPELPRLLPHSPHRYSEVQINDYLASAAFERCRRGGVR